MTNEEMIQSTEIIFNQMVAAGGFKSIGAAMKAGEAIEHMRDICKENEELRKKLDSLEKKRRP